MPLHVKNVLTVLALSLLVSVPGFAAEPGPCGDEERQAYLQAAESGMSADELMQMFAHCTEPAPAGLSKTITVNNGLASTWYEQMNGCGYHPQVGVAACDVELKRTGGYGSYPSGSTEHVTFCFQCGGAGWVAVPGSVHVTNNTSAASPSYGFMAYAFPPAGCPSGGTGASFTVRATLSWAVPASNACSSNPTMVWGNQITFDTRDDP